MAIPARALDLSTPLDRPFIRIDAVDYDLRVVDDFTVVELRQLDRLMPRLAPLAHKLDTTAATEADCQTLSALLSVLVELVLLAPAVVLASLSDVDRLKVFVVFLGTLATGRAAAKEPEVPEGQRLTWEETVARLQRFYAGDPTGWSTAVPIGMVKRLLGKIPRLTAEESITESTRVSMGSGLGNAEDRNRIWREWQTASTSDRQAIAARPSPAQLRAMGIKVRRVQKKSTPSTAEQA